MNNLHIYTSEMKPATSFWEPEVLIYPDCCKKKRPAKDCTFQEYYDGTYVWCAPGKGCKDPVFIAEKKAHEFARRSAGQKLRQSNKLTRKEC